MSDRLRIGVWLNSTPHGGGSFQYALTTLLSLGELHRRQPNKYEFVYFSATPEWKSLLEENAVAGDGDFVVLNRSLIVRMIGRLARTSEAGLRLWRWFNQAVPSTYRAVYEKDVDVMLSTASDVFAGEIAVPTVSVIHDLMHRYEPGFSEVGSAKAIRERESLFRSMCRFCRILLVDSELGKQHVQESYGEVLKAEVMVLPFLPAPYVLHHDPKGDHASVRAKYRLPESYVFYPSQFWEHKNHHRLIEAIKLLQDQGITVNAVLVGSEKNNFARVCRLIEELGLNSQVQILGYVPDEDIVGLYKCARALVMPTFFGPTNIPIVEALFLGVPVACSDLYAMPEQVGEAGLLFDPTSVADIAEKIGRLWTDASLRAELVRKGYDRVKDMTIEDYAWRWEGIIEAAVHLSEVPQMDADAKVARVSGS